MTAALGAALLFLLSSAAFAARPTAPGKPVASVNGQQVKLTWKESQDDNEVSGYNVYLNDSYLKTVFTNRFTGMVDTSQDNEFYITAFDMPKKGEARSYSTRSETIVIEQLGADNPLPPAADDAVDLTPPSVPQALQLVSALPDAITIRWAPSTDNVGVVGYNIYRQGKYTATVFSTQYTDADPLTGSSNDYTVVAFDEARNYTPQSSMLSILAPDAGQVEPPQTPVNPDPPTPTQPPVEPEAEVLDVTAPSIPDGLVIPVATLAGVTLEWNAASDDIGVDGYNVYRNGDYLTTVRNTVFIDTRPITDGSLNYSVVAFDEARNFSPRSSELAVTEFANEPVKPGSPDVPEPPAEPEPPQPSPDNPATPNPEPEPVDPGSPGEMVPVLDPSNRFPSPDPDDPFASRLEIDPETPEPGGPPTTPKNLRIDLVSNDWAEFSWAPANDDTGVAAYNIYRNDGVRYVVSPDLTDPNAGSQAEIDKYWSTTSFIDCNFTRFDTRVHNCRANQPVPGETYTYQVSAVDIDGQESAYSEPLSITYHLPRNAPVPIFDDFFKMPDDRFAQSNDLSETRFFLDEFELVFSDEFNGSSLDPTKWQTELTWQDSIIINGEQQYFVRTQADPEFGYNPFSFDGETLTISAIPTPDNLRDKLPAVCDEVDPTGNERCQFLSGALSSHDRFGFLYGYVEGRMKVGGTPGMLSSFYLYHRYKGTGVNLHAPEIDIVEYLGENPFGAEDAFQTYHFEDVNTGLTRSAPTMAYSNPDGELYSDGYHTFGVLWEPQLVVWYIDGKEVKRLTGPMVSRQPMNIVNYLVTGSAWAPTPDLSDPTIYPLEYKVDYIRVYQRDAYRGTAAFGP